MTATESYLPDTAVQPKISKKQIFFTALTVLGVLSPIIVYARNDAPIRPKDEKVVVQKGDTVYGFIAKEYPESVNVNQAEYEIEQRNGIMCAGDLQVGDVLYMPVIN